VTLILVVLPHYFTKNRKTLCTFVVSFFVYLVRINPVGFEFFTDGGFLLTRGEKTDVGEAVDAADLLDDSIYRFEFAGNELNLLACGVDFMVDFRPMGAVGLAVTRDPLDAVEFFDFEN